jgi:hypothetical protein
MEHMMNQSININPKKNLAFFCKIVEFLKGISLCYSVRV